MKLNSTTIDKNSCVFDNLTKPTVQQTDSIDKLVAVLHTTTEDILRLNKIIKALMSANQKDIIGAMGIKLNCNKSEQPAKKRKDSRMMPKETTLWSNSVGMIAISQKRLERIKGISL